MRIAWLKLVVLTLASVAVFAAQDRSSLVAGDVHQERQRPAGQQQESRPKPQAPAVQFGVITGSVFWETTKLKKQILAPGCSGVAVAAGAVATGAPSFQTNPVGMLQPLTYSNAGSFAICSYAFQDVPLSTNLRVTVNVSPNQFNIPVSVSYFGGSNLFRITGGMCNQVVRTSNLPAQLRTKMEICGDLAFNVNFELVPAGAARP